MYKSLNKLVFVITLSSVISACGTLKNVGKEIGQTTKKVTTEIGHTTRDVTKEIGHATRDAVKKTAEVIKEN